METIEWKSSCDCFTTGQGCWAWSLWVELRAGRGTGVWVPGSSASPAVAGPARNLGSRKLLVEIGTFWDRVFIGVLSLVCQVWAQMVLWVIPLEPPHHWAESTFLSAGRHIRRPSLGEANPWLRVKYLTPYVFISKPVLFSSCAFSLSSRASLFM